MAANAVNNIINEKLNYEKKVLIKKLDAPLQNMILL